MIENGVSEFYVGGYGDFDMLVAKVLGNEKAKGKKMHCTLVIPYLGRKINEIKDKGSYDEILYPPIENTPKKFAIIKRNYWMVEHADIVVAWVEYSRGGAYSVLEYAMRKKKTVINLCENNAQ